MLKALRLLDGVRSGSFPTVGATPFVNPVWVFLERARFAAKTLGFRGWISLDSLARIEIYQRVTRDFRERLFPRAFVVAKEPSKQRAHDSVCGREGSFMGQA
jgi:hypothetical protein